MHRIRLPLAALALLLLAACQSAAPTAPEAPQQPNASTGAGRDSIPSGVERGGSLIGSGN
jgi:outer membrane biogenesis lipoprotein LolB